MIELYQFLFRIPMKRAVKKRIKHWIGDLLLNGLLTLMTILLFPLKPKNLAILSKILGIFSFLLLKNYRQRVLNHLTLVFGPGKDKKKRTNLAREIFIQFALTPLETVYAYSHSFDQFLRKIKIQGKEYLDQALLQGKGVIALGAHLGSFTLVGARLSLEHYRFNIMINEGNYPRLWRRLGKYQKRMGQNPFPAKPLSTSLKKSLNALHRNEILYLIADEQHRNGGIPVHFFNHLAYTPIGPALLSLKTGAPILPMFILRRERLPHTLFIGPPVEIERTGEMKKDIENLTIAFTKLIEERIREVPTQWPWLNRRWKLPPQHPT